MSISDNASLGLTAIVALTTQEIDTIFLGERLLRDIVDVAFGGMELVVVEDIVDRREDAPVAFANSAQM